MNNKVKLIWEMRGLDAKGMAEHHAIHLKEYAERSALKISEAGTEAISDLFYLAYLVIDKTDVEVVQSALRPHLVEEE